MVLAALALPGSIMDFVLTSDRGPKVAAGLALLALALAATSGTLASSCSAAGLFAAGVLRAGAAVVPLRPLVHCAPHATGSERILLQLPLGGDLCRCGAVTSRCVGLYTAAPVPRWFAGLVAPWFLALVLAAPDGARPTSEQAGRFVDIADDLSATHRSCLPFDVRVNIGAMCCSIDGVEAGCQKPC